MQRVSRRTVKAVLLLILGGVGALFVAYSVWMNKHALDGVPSSIEVQGQVFSADQLTGFTEGCGIRIHRISEKSLQGIRAKRLAFFTDARTGRNHEKLFRYDEWKATPPSDGDAPVLRGLCTMTFSDPLEATLVDAIQHAAHSHGSYYAVGYEYDILVVPHLGIVVVSFAG